MFLAVIGVYAAVSIDHAVYRVLSIFYLLVLFSNVLAKAAIVVMRADKNQTNEAP